MGIIYLHDKLTEYLEPSEESVMLYDEYEDAFIGLLLDGFPVYGPIENNQTIRSLDLDEYHGHSHATKDFPGGIYHYHITSDDPYIIGSGYYGNPGTVRN